MKILVSGKHFPMAGMNYFKWAMEELGHEVFSFGYFSGATVPWEGNPQFPQYVFPPNEKLKEDIPIWDYKHINLPWKPDLVLQIDAGFYLINVPKDIPNAMFATDPHFLDYTVQHGMVDYFFNPQPSTFHKYPKGIPLYWAHDPNIHKPNPQANKIYDIVFIGLMYDKRKLALDRLSSKYNVFSRSAGIIYQECTDIYNKGKMSFNWSSNDDIPMRIFEGMAYGTCIVTNRITGLEEIFKEDKHYLGFDSIEELEQKVGYYLKNPEKMNKIAEAGYMAVEKHTYKNRCKDILKEVFG